MGFRILPTFLQLTKIHICFERMHTAPCTAPTLTRGMRFCLVSAEIVDPIFSGNGVASRSVARCLLSRPDNSLLVVCGRPAEVVGREGSNIPNAFLSVAVPKRAIVDVVVRLSPRCDIQGVSQHPLLSAEQPSTEA
jgi:hypothetical protein